MSAPASTVETIAAIATPPGRGGIGVVRISGGDLAALIHGLIGRLPAPRVATVATFRDARGAPLDAGLALYFPAPHSYTGESVLELHGHGGPAVLRLVLARCLELGARIAEPGEFTRRAFMNGKLDLVEAESVADLIEAATGTAARAAARSLSGVFSQEVNALVSALIDLRMYTEATLDFPDEDIEFLQAGSVAAKFALIGAKVATALTRARTGALLRSGLTVVLVGRPNVGKSSLLNRWSGEDAAIVTPIAGTTRDLVERQVELAGIPLNIVDTAGLRESHDEVERIGIARTWAAVERADLALLLVDARAADGALDPEDAALLGRLPPALPRLVVHNKADLADITPRAATRNEAGVARRHVWLSAKAGAGMALLEAEVRALTGATVVGEDVFLARERHVTALRAAQAHLDAAAAHLRTVPPPVELFAEELYGAQQALAAITGEFSADDLLGEIFSRFCIGK
jgi:tRNA modification GTPase